MPLWFWAWFTFIFIAPVGLACLAAWDVKRRGLPWVRVIVWGILFWPVALYLWGYARGAQVGIVTWSLGVAACIFLTWMILRIDEYPVEVVPSGLGLVASIGSLWFIRARAPERA